MFASTSDPYLDTSNVYTLRKSSELYSNEYTSSLAYYPNVVNTSAVDV